MNDLLADATSYAHGPLYAELARRRAEEPVAWVGDSSRTLTRAGQVVRNATAGHWAVTRHADVIHVSRTPATFSSWLGGVFVVDAPDPAGLDRHRQSLINMDAPEHTRIRRIVSRAFTPQAVKRMGDSVQETARRVVADAVQAENFDGVRDLAAEVPLLVIAELFGMPRADRHLLYDWSNRLIGFEDPDFGGGSVESFVSTFVETLGYIRGLAAKKRRDPGDDLISTLVQAQHEDGGLTEEEFHQLWILLMVAGNDTTRNLISGGIDALLDHPDQLQRLVRGEVAVAIAAEELLRWVTPIMVMRRTATIDTVLGGQAIAAGDKVVLYYTSANRDDEVFRSPDQLDLGRDPNPHLAFGFGAHVCLGAHLARLEAKHVFHELLPVLSHLRRPASAEHVRSSFMNGLKCLPLTYDGPR